MRDSLLLRRILVTAVFAVPILLAGSFVSSRLAAMRKEPQRSDAQASAIAVSVKKLSRSTFQEQIVGYGRARSLKTTRVSAEITASVLWLSPALEAGGALNKDDEVVRLDARDLQELVLSWEARLGRTSADRKRIQRERKTQEEVLVIAREELETAKRELERIRELETRNAATRSEIDRQLLAVALRKSAVRNQEGRITSFDAQLERVDAEAKEMEATIRNAQLDLSRTVIRAPYAGRIERRWVELGARVAPGTQLFDLVDLSRVEIPVALPASRYGDVRVGARASVRLGDNQAWEGAVARVSPSVNAADRTFFVYLVVENPAPSSAVPPGAFVTARIDGRRFEDVYVLPRTAFVGEHIFVVDGDQARARKPHIRFTLPHVLLADAGVEDGAEVIVTNLEEVSDGTRITPVRAGPHAEDS